MTLVLRLEVYLSTGIEEILYELRLPARAVFLQPWLEGKSILLSVVLSLRFSFFGMEREFRRTGVSAFSSN